MKDVRQPFESGISGAAPDEWYGKEDPVGARAPYALAPVGSVYVKKPNTKMARRFTKLNANGRNDDWASLVHCVQQRVTRAMFTDGGAAVGTYDLLEQIPQGAIVLRAELLDVLAFLGNTSAVVTLGDGTDVDRYNTGTPSVFTNNAVLDVGVPSGAVVHTAAVTPRVTVTGGSDFTNISAGEMTVRIWYLG